MRCVVQNRELQIMKQLRHSNVVELKSCFYTNGEKPEEVYLNLLLEFVPETIYRIIRHYSRSARQIPSVLAKLYMYQVRCAALRGSKMPAPETHEQLAKHAQFEQQAVSSAGSGSILSQPPSHCLFKPRAHLSTQYPWTPRAPQVARSLAYIHENGVCHRDIKPQNLLLDPNSHVVKLCDFGSAKMLVPGKAKASQNLPAVLNFGLSISLV